MKGKGASINAKEAEGNLLARLLRGLRLKHSKPGGRVGGDSKRYPKKARATCSRCLGLLRYDLTNPGKQSNRRCKKLLEKENAWYTDEAPPNVVNVESEKHLKSLVMSEKDVVVDFFSPGCLGCKAMWPKVKKLAHQNPEIIFAKVNTMDEGLMKIADGLKVQKLPWFLLFSCGEMVASLTANLSTFDVLRAEIASLKECTEPECNM